MVSERALEIAVAVEGRDQLMKSMAVLFVLLTALVMPVWGRDPGTRFPVCPDRWTAGDSAFEHCSGLNIVILPSSMKKIGYHAFSKCPRVGTVYAFGIDASRMKSKLTRSGLSVGEVRLVEVKHDGRERE